MRKPITFAEAAPRPWRLARSEGGKVYIYAKGEQQPIELIRVPKYMTRRERATLQLICDAVNHFSAAWKGEGSKVSKAQG